MTAKFIVADVFDGLATLPDDSVDVAITSPPFLALRSYLPKDHPDKGKEIGSESTPAEFLDVMFRFTAELRRVIAPHGSIAVELGDTYAGGGGGVVGDRYQGKGDSTWSRPNYAEAYNQEVPATAGAGWPLSKSKTLIPELYRIGLAYGINPLTGEESPAGKWRVRNVVTWARPNPPVGALGDKWRPATSDVVIACLSGKRFWDDLATRKPHTESTMTRREYGYKVSQSLVSAPNRGDYGEVGREFNSDLNPSGAPLLDYWEIPLDGGEPTKYGPQQKPRESTRVVSQKAADGDWQSRNRGGYSEAGDVWHNHPAGSPLLDYWEIPPTGYSGSHYAVFPPALVVPLVQAMCPPKVCLECGEPSRRIVESQSFYKTNGQPTKGGRLGNRQVDGIAPRGHDTSTKTEYATLGWTDCGHNNYRPGLVLDPFAGSGTTGLVATGFGHDAVLIDLDERNAVLAEERIGGFLFEREEA